MSIAHLAIAIALAGCVSGPTQPTLVLEGEAATPEVIEGARAWERVGFAVEPTSDLPVCAHDWAALGEVNCQFPILVIWDDVRVHGGLSNHELRRVRIGIESDVDAQRRLGAHEVGHLVLGTPDHLPDGVGVMSIGPTGWVLTARDRVFACGQIGACGD